MDDKYVFTSGKKLSITESLFSGFVDIRRCNTI